MWNLQMLNLAVEHSEQCNVVLQQEAAAAAVSAPGHAQRYIRICGKCHQKLGV
jgi:cytochrome c5